MHRRAGGGRREKPIAEIAEEQRYAEAATRGPRFARHGAKDGANHKRYSKHQAFVIGPSLAPWRRPKAAGHASQLSAVLCLSASSAIGFLRALRLLSALLA